MPTGGWLRPGPLMGGLQRAAEKCACQLLDHEQFQAKQKKKRIFLSQVLQLSRILGLRSSSAARKVCADTFTVRKLIDLVPQRAIHQLRITYKKLEPSLVIAFLRRNAASRV